MRLINLFVTLIVDCHNSEMVLFSTAAWERVRIVFLRLLFGGTGQHGQLDCIVVRCPRQ